MVRIPIWIVGGSFIVFGAIAWAITGWSPSYAGLVVMGCVAVALGWILG